MLSGIFCVRRQNGRDTLLHNSRLPIVSEIGGRHPARDPAGDFFLSIPPLFHVECLWYYIMLDNHACMRIIHMWITI